MKKKLIKFIADRRDGISILRNHKTYNDQSVKAKMLREERADGQEWIVELLEETFKKELNL